jgi:predicted dithiol-disulfide oxidoreductase (DUF899 family)
LSEEGTVNYHTASDKMADYRRQLADLRKKMRAVQADREPEIVQNYEFETTAGPMHLSELFGDRDDLILIHNMGRACGYCTLWADGFNGIYHHLVDRAAFVVSSPDAPAVQAAFAESRGWRFPMVSHGNTTFAADMGYRSKDGGWMPGISVFRREKTRIVRVSDSGFQPNDDFCTMWHILDLFPEGSAGWGPKISLDRRAVPSCCAED